MCLQQAKKLACAVLKPAQQPCCISTHCAAAYAVCAVSPLHTGIEPLMVRIIQSRVEAALHKDCPAAAQLAAASAGNSPEAAAEEVLATAAVGAAQQQ